MSATPYGIAVLFATASAITALLIIPSFVWHVQHCNIGAATVTLLAIVANLMNLLNAVIWPNDDFASWFSGVGVCDVEVKLQVIMQAAFPAALACMLYALARILDARRASWRSTAAQRRRLMIVEIVLCAGLPVVQALTAWIVQPLRFYVNGIAGCQPAVDDSWLAAVLMLGPRLVWTTICVYLSGLVIFRLINYRFTVTSMLTHHNTTKSRFTRLYVLCSICVLGLFPMEIWLDYVAISSGLTAFNWNQTHHPTDYEWNSIVFVPSDGAILLDRYIWLAGGWIVFLTFGIGPDGLSMYRRILVKLGLGRLFPRLMLIERTSSSTANTSSRSTMMSTVSLMSSKFMGTFRTKRPGSLSEASTQSHTSTLADLSSPCEKIEFTAPTKDFPGPLSEADAV